MNSFLSIHHLPFFFFLANASPIDKGLEASVAAQREAVSSDEEKDRQKFLDNDGTIIEMSEEEIQKFRDICIPIQDKLCEQINMTDILNEIRELG